MVVPRGVMFYSSFFLPAVCPWVFLACLFCPSVLSIYQPLFWPTAFLTDFLCMQFVHVGDSAKKWFLLKVCVICHLPARTEFNNAIDRPFSYDQREREGEEKGRKRRQILRQKFTYCTHLQILRKIFIIVATRCHLLRRLKCTKIKIVRSKYHLISIWPPWLHGSAPLHNEQYDLGS